MVSRAPTSSARRGATGGHGACVSLYLLHITRSVRVMAPDTAGPGRKKAAH